MGAHFSYFTIETENRKEVEDRFEREQDTAAYDHGHSYSGDINMADGLKFVNKSFSCEGDAHEYVSDTAEKWGPALAVRYQNEKGNLCYFVGAWCAS